MTGVMQRSLMRKYAQQLAPPHTPASNRRLGRCKARVLNKERPITLQQSTTSFESSDEDRPTTSGSAGGLLFDESHISTWHPELIAYAPVGAVLATFRSLLWILGIYLDQPWFRNQAVVEAYLRLLGVTVVWKHPERIPPGRHLMVSNHCSVGDLMMLFSHPSLPHRYTHLITSALPARVTQARNLPVLMRPASPAVYDELAAADGDAGASPVHLFPEGGMTNGRGMLRFSRGFTRIMQPQSVASAPSACQTPTQTSQLPQSPPQQLHHYLHQQQELPQHMKLEEGLRSERGSVPEAGDHEDSGHGDDGVVRPPLPVVPVALRVRGMAGVSSHTLTSAFLANLFWFSFSPRTTLEATVLPAMVPLPGEARGHFVNRVQAAIADELGVDVFDMTIQQKRQLVKQAEARRR